MPCTNNTPSLAASFPEVSAVDRWPWSPCITCNESRVPSTAASLTLRRRPGLRRCHWKFCACAVQIAQEIRRERTKSSTFHSLDEGSGRCKNLYIYRFLTARSRASTLKQLCLSVISDATLKHFIIPTSTMSNHKGNLESDFNLFSIWFNTCYHVWWHDQLFACCFGRSPCTIHEMWILEVEIAAKPWCNDNKVAANTPNTSRGNRRYRGKIS